MKNNMMYKSEVQSILRKEVLDCKKNKQVKVFAQWVYSLGEIRYCDTVKQFDAQVQLYKSQGIKFTHSTVLPKEESDAIGARRIILHVYCDKTKDRKHPIDPFAALMGRITGTSEFVIYEIVI